MGWIMARGSPPAWRANNNNNNNNKELPILMVGGKMRVLDRPSGVECREIRLV
jgi:hypothetical protein